MSLIVAKTECPARASVTAVARPIPVLEPVTKATAMFTPAAAQTEGVRFGLLRTNAPGHVYPHLGRPSQLSMAALIFHKCRARSRRRSALGRRVTLFAPL